MVGAVNMNMNMKRNILRISEIVKLKQMTRKWRSVAVKGCAISPKSGYQSPMAYDSDQESPPDVPEGYLAVYVVSEERTRFIIPTSYLSSPVFRTLLDKAEEEFGFNQQGAITIPCETRVFEHVLKVLATDKADRQKPLSLRCTEPEAIVDSARISLPKSFC